MTNAGIGWVVTLSLLGAGLAGCNSVPPYTEARAERFGPPQVQLTGPDRGELQENTVFDRPIVQRDAADLLHVTVPIRNTGRQVMHVQYKVAFLDASGAPLPGYPTGQFRAQLEPGAWTPIKFNSTSPRAENWQMELRYARVVH